MRYLFKKHSVSRTAATALVVALAAMLTAATLTAGCLGRKAQPAPPVSQPPGSGEQPGSPAEPATPPAGPGPAQSPSVQFREVFSSEVEGDIWASNPDETVSPDGKWVLAVQSGAFGAKMSALPLDPSAGKPRVLDSVDQAWVANHFYSYYPMGWLSNTQCLFAAQGRPHSGPNKGKNGVVVFAANVLNEQPSVEQVAFINLPEGHMTTAFLVPARKKAYFHVSKAIWEFDVDTNKMRLVKGDLPTYDGLFYPKPSPDGRYFVYDRYDTGAAGVFLLDTETGEEKALLETGETMSFQPSWSPNGKYIAAYTVNPKAGAKPADPRQGVDWEAYDLLSGEDGPQPSGNAISVMDLNGKVIQTIKVEGKRVNMFKWGSGSNAIAFTAGNTLVESSPMEQVLPDSVWLVPSGDALSQGAEGAPLQAATVTCDKPDEIVFVAIGLVDRDGAGVVYNEHRGDRSIVKHARLESSKEPDAMEGSFESWMMNYVNNDPAVGVVGGQTSTVYVFEQRGWSKVFRSPSGRQSVIIGYNGDVLAVVSSPPWNMDTKPGVEPEKAVVKGFRVIK